MLATDRCCAPVTIVVGEGDLAAPAAYNHEEAADLRAASSLRPSRSSYKKNPPCRRGGSTKRKQSVEAQGAILDPLRADGIDAALGPGLRNDH